MREEEKAYLRARAGRARRTDKRGSSALRKSLKVGKKLILKSKIKPHGNLRNDTGITAAIRRRGIREGAVFAKKVGGTAETGTQKRQTQTKPIAFIPAFRIRVARAGRRNIIGSIRNTRPIGVVFGGWV